MITQKLLKSVVHYNPETGSFTRIKSRNSKLIGRNAGVSDGCEGYLKVFVSGKLYLAHRLAWLYVTGSMPKDCIDHVDHNRTNNSFYNLREATKLDNRTNCPMRSNNKSGYTGVHWCVQSKKWKAQISISGKKISLGIFNDLDDAVKARLEAEVENNYHPNHGRNV